jgi:hypothetical protein
VFLDYLQSFFFLKKIGFDVFSGENPWQRWKIDAYLEVPHMTLFVSLPSHT